MSEKVKMKKNHTKQTNKNKKEKRMKHRTNRNNNKKNKKKVKRKEYNKRKRKTKKKNKMKRRESKFYINKTTENIEYEFFIGLRTNCSICILYISKYFSYNIIKKNKGLITLSI